MRFRMERRFHRQRPPGQLVLMTEATPKKGLYLAFNNYARPL